MDAYACLYYYEDTVKGPVVACLHVDEIESAESLGQARDDWSVTLVK